MTSRDKQTIIKAILNRERISIMYVDRNNPNNDPILSGRRIDIEPVAMGLSLAGNPVIRAYVLSGVSLKNNLPDWKLFRLDRITRVFKSAYVKAKVRKKNFNKQRYNYNASGDELMIRIDYHSGDY